MTLMSLAYENQYCSFTELATVLSRMIDGVLSLLRKIEIVRRKTEPSILDEIERVILTRNNVHSNILSVGLEIEYCKAFELD